MPGLPTCSGADAIRAFERAGWRKDRQRGSHITLTRENSPVALTVPLHDTPGRGILRTLVLVRKAGLTVDEFADLLP